MNTNGTSSGDTWGQERQGWAPLVEQRGDEEREVAEMPRCGVLGDLDPRSNTRDAQTMARDEGSTPPAGH